MNVRLVKGSRRGRTTKLKPIIVPLAKRCRAEQQMTAAANGEAPPSRRRKWRQLEQRIVRLKNQFINGNRNLEEYWSAVAHCICHFQ
ncbi:hypothetical protein ACOMHN_054059 [Nucella lapillus]